MTNKIHYLVTVNGRTVKSDYAFVKNTKLREFEEKLRIRMNNELKLKPKDELEILFR